MSSMPVLEVPSCLSTKTQLVWVLFRVCLTNLLLPLKTIFLHSRDDRCALSRQGANRMVGPQAGTWQPRDQHQSTWPL